MDKEYESEVELLSFTDKRGTLRVGQWPEQLPFVVKRFFVVSEVPNGEERGVHAHKECHQLLICLAGTIKAVIDDGFSRKTYKLEQHSPVIHMPPLTWGTQYGFSDDAILLVLASHEYSPEDYIHSYQEFMSIMKLKKTQ
jgi:UDP-2-acetamido-3-amino-2,3-dideoxy-glucuronate N-acetyltransferase